MTRPTRSGSGEARTVAPFNPHGLDGKGDGVPCEQLPDAP